MKRLSTILDQLTVSDADAPAIRSLKQKASLQAIRVQFELSKAQLELMSTYFVHEMHQGLAKDGATIRMLPTYVYRNSPKIDGVFYALDIGGTNFRVIRMSVQGGQLQHSHQAAFKIPDEHKVGPTAHATGMFGFIAEAIGKFLADDAAAHGAPSSSDPTPLGFTFSFPMVQTAIDKGSLLKWTKGFTTEGVVGNDVVGLLQRELDSRKVNVKVVALCNDTVGTLIARLFGDSSTEMGVILGTGSNGCYWERSRNIVKDPSLDRGSKEMCINMEFGNFDSHKLNVLPVTPYDDEIDQHSPNKGSQRFEKMISGLYLGEIARLILVALSKNGALPPTFAERLGDKAYAFTSRDASLISSDILPGLHLVGEILEREYKVHCDQPSDRFVVREVCRLVASRSAQLAGMAIAATLIKAEKNGDATVAIDGSVFEKTPYYKATLLRTIKTLVGEDADIRCVLQKDGSGLGAGFIAAMTVSK